eukprot:gene22648-27342_t
MSGAEQPHGLQALLNALSAPGAGQAPACAADAPPDPASSERGAALGVSELLVGDNGLGRGAAAALAAWIPGHGQHLAVLDLSSNPQLCEGHGGQEALARGLLGGRGAPLREVHLDRCGLHGGGAAEVLRALRGFPQLELVSLAHNPQLTEGGRDLRALPEAAALMGSTEGRLESLELQGVGLRDEGAAALAAAVGATAGDSTATERPLRHLGLSNNGLTGTGAAALVAVLVADEAAKEAAECWVLETLDLRGNTISEQGIRDLREVGSESDTDILLTAVVSEGGEDDSEEGEDSNETDEDEEDRGSYASSDDY